MTVTDFVLDTPTVTTTAWRSRAIPARVGREDLDAAVLDNMRDGVLTLDPRGRVTTVNPALEEMLTVSAEALVGQTFAETMLARDDLADFNDVILQAIYEPQRTITQQVIVERLGRKRYYSVRTNLLLNPAGGAPLGVIVVVSDETSQVLALIRQKEFGQLLSLLIISLTIGSLSMLALFRFVDLDAVVGSGSAVWVQITWLYLVLIALPALFFVWQTDIPITSFGFNRAKLRNSLIEGLAISAVVVAFLLCVALGLRLALPAYAERPLIDWSFFYSWFLVSYLLHSFVQEFVARGVMQTVFMRVLDDQRGIRSVFLASLVFAALHAHFGFVMVAISFLSGLLFGAIYHRHGNLAGVTIVHMIGGAMVFALGFIGH
ncbi:MAG: PAS domain-containing protein [Pseudomonadota bacterium]